jgi:hypothetical protein
VKRQLPSDQRSAENLRAALCGNREQVADPSDPVGGHIVLLYSGQCAPELQQHYQRLGRVTSEVQGA